MAARLQPLPEQVKVYRPAVSGLEPDSVTFADAAGLLLLPVSRRVYGDDDVARAAALVGEVGGDALQRVTAGPVARGEGDSAL